MTILVNQFLVQIMIVFLQLDNSHEDILGVVMLILQILVISFAMTMIVPAFSPAISKLSDAVSGVFSPIYERHRASSRGRRGESTPDEKAHQTVHTSLQPMPPLDEHTQYPAEGTSDRRSICSETSTAGIQEEQMIRSETEHTLLRPPTPSEEDVHDSRANDSAMGEPMWLNQGQPRQIFTSNPIFTQFYP